MRVSRACVLGFMGLSVATLFCVYLRGAESQTPAAKAPDLLQRVAVLEERVAQLEKRLAEQPLPAYPIAPPAATGVPGSRPARPVPQGPPVPPGVPHLFNGQTFYITPLGKEAARKSGVLENE
jgi:hypothetical protein